MPTPYIGQIDLFPFSFAPKGYALCNGQLLQIAQNAALFSLLGVQYGGDGNHTFALPNLQGRVPVGQGGGGVIGGTGGEAAHTLLAAEMPVHGHGFTALASPPATLNAAAATALPGVASGADSRGGTEPYDIYVADAAPNQALAAQSVGTTGGGQPHNNLMPYTVLSACIALQGIFPSRN